MCKVFNTISYIVYDADYTSGNCFSLSLAMFEITMVVI